MKNAKPRVYVCLTGVVATRYSFYPKDSSEKKEGVTYHVLIGETSEGFGEYTALYLAKCSPDFMCHSGDTFGQLYYDRYGRILGGVGCDQ